MSRAKWKMMSPREQRIKVAELCGWHPTCTKYFTMPDYINDLNAMHEAKKLLSKDQQHDYEMHLLKMEYPGWGIRVTHATAAQRAEAFVLTMEKE